VHTRDPHLLVRTWLNHANHCELQLQLSITMPTNSAVLCMTASLRTMSGTSLKVRGWSMRNHRVRLGLTQPSPHPQPQPRVGIIQRSAAETTEYRVRVWRVTSRHRRATKMLTFTPLSGAAKSSRTSPLAYLLQVDDINILLDCGSPDWCPESHSSTEGDDVTENHFHWERYCDKLRECVSNCIQPDFNSC
jgi:hypothetical protein